MPPAVGDDEGGNRPLPSALPRVAQGERVVGVSDQQWELGRAVPTRVRMCRTSAGSSMPRRATWQALYFLARITAARGRRTRNGDLAQRIFVALAHNAPSSGELLRLPEKPTIVLSSEVQV